MGDIADSLIDGEFDYITGEYIGSPCGYPRTFSNYQPSLSKKKRSKIKKIKTEIAIKIESLKAEGLKEGHALNKARCEANKKYGKGWRDGIFNELK